MARKQRAITVALDIELRRNGHSFKWLSAKMGISAPTVSNQLRHAKGPKEDFLRDVAKAMGLSYKGLLALAEQEHEHALQQGRAMLPPLVNGPHRP